MENNKAELNYNNKDQDAELPPHKEEVSNEIQFSQEGGTTLGVSSQDIEPNTIVFHAGENVEVLRFTDTEMFLYGNKTDCPEDVITAMREFLTGQGYFNRYLNE